MVRQTTYYKRMNHATKIVTENALDQWSDMGFEDDYRVAAADLQDYYTRLMEDFCENYDEQWFALIATPAIQKTIDWEAVAEAVNNMLVDDIDQPNTYPYKKCSVCSERSSCGNYNDNKEWICEECGEEDDEKVPLTCRCGAETIWVEKYMISANASMVCDECGLRDERGEFAGFS